MLGRYVKSVIYVDHQLKACSKDTEGARKAIYKPEFELYAVEKPKHVKTELDED